MLKPILAAEGFSFGCDPEFFITNDKGELVSAAGLIPGTKKEPHKVDKGAVQVDGMAAEVNIDPASSFKEFNDNLVLVMSQLKDMLPPGFGFLIQPSVRFSEAVMDAQTAEAKMLGCEPDFNAWSGEENPVPDTSKDPLLRTASGHVHIGWTEGQDPFGYPHFDHCRDLAKQLDWYLGAPAMQLDPDVTRRQLYGKAGAIRPKPYGVEYRTLSNFWISSKQNRCWVWNRMNKAINDMREWFAAESASKANSEIIAYINEGKEPSDKIMRAYSYPLLMGY